MNAFEEKDYSKKIDFGIWKHFLQYAKSYKKHLILLAIVMVAVAAVDAALPAMNKYAIDNFIVPRQADKLLGFGILYVIVIVIQAVNVWLLIAIAGKIDMGLCYDIRKAGFKRLQELSFSYYDKTPVGWMMARLTSDCSRLGDTVAWGVVDFVWGVTMMFAISGIMLYLNWKLALLTMVVVPPLALISWFFQKRILKSYRTVRKTNSKITGAFNEGIMGAKTTKTLVREEANLEEFQEITDVMEKSSVRAAVYSSLYLPIVMALGTVGMGIALWFGGNKVMTLGISYGTLVAFISYSVQFFEPVREIARIFAEFQSAQAAAERVVTMIETEPDIKDSKNVLNIYGDSFNPKSKNWSKINGRIEFKDVSFSYKEGETVLDRFDLDVHAGETIALVGETGSGKSTIVNLACRFYEPTSGKILIDGEDYKNRSQLWLQSNLGYVLQAPHLFSGTIKENIRYGNLEASDEEVIRASKLVNADEFIGKMDKGYDSEVGEGGNRLSTGQKQLISFARAVLADPKIFVLDEATSSVDTETEQLIQEAIHTVLEGRTSFIIAHRLSTIKSADRILVIRNGKITESGNHHELINRKGYYYNLYTNQFVDEREIELLHA